MKSAEEYMRSLDESVWRSPILSDIKEAFIAGQMEARQQAEGFAEWINDNFYYQYQGKWYKSEYDDVVEETTSEMYNKYLEHLQQKIEQDNGK